MSFSGSLEIMVNNKFSALLWIGDKTLPHSGGKRRDV